jgi:hypothetical protein
MILDVARQGLTVSAIARRTGHDRKTIRKYMERGLEPPVYKPREPSPSRTGSGAASAPASSRERVSSASHCAKEVGPEREAGGRAGRGRHQATCPGRCLRLVLPKRRLGVRLAQAPVLVLLGIFPLLPIPFSILADNHASRRKQQYRLVTTEFRG